MLPFEPSGVEVVPLTRPPTAASRFPLHVRPAADEALVSWLWRLACRLRVSIGTLSGALIETPVLGEAVAWCRPNDRVLQHIAARTGAHPEALRTMTFAAWSRRAHDDEIGDRFSGLRFMRSGRRASRRDGLSVCPACFRDEPYVRLSWMLGWTSACAKHALVLVTRCPHCNSRLQLPRAVRRTPAPMECCAQCGGHISAARQIPAHADVVKLEEALMVGKRSGRVDLPGLGAMNWPDAAAVLDVLLTVVRGGPTEAHQRDLHATIGRDFNLPIEQVRHWSSRYGSSLTLAWLLQDWPHNLNRGCRILRSESVTRVIARCTEVGQLMRDSLRVLFRPPPRADRLAGRRWIANLPSTPQELRDQAIHARYRHRRERLLALAELRDGRSMQEAATVAGGSESALNRWLNAGARGGLESALAAKRGGRVIVSHEEAEHIVHWLTQMPTRGRPRRKALSVAHVIGYGRERFGMEIPARLAGQLLAAHRRRGMWRGVRHEDARVSAQLRNIFRGYGT